MKISPAIRSALRLVRRSSLRSAIVIGAIAVPTALATAGNLADWSGAAALTWSAVAVAVAVLLATQSSPEPTSLATIGAWRVAGASPSASRRPHRLAGLLLCWTGAAVGIGVGSLVGLAGAGDRGSWGGVLTLGLALGLVGAVALFPSPHPHRSVSKRRLVDPGLVKLLGGLALVGAIAATIGAAGLVHTDADADVVVPFAATVTILVVSVALGPALHALLASGRRIPALRPVLAAATRHRTPAIVRVAVVAAMVVALTAVLLGASVGGRTNRYQKAIAELQHVPVVPPTVMAITVPNARTPGIDPLPGGALSSETVAAIGRQYPDAEVIPVTWATSTPDRGFACLFDSRCALPVIVADPRLAGVYGQTARPSDLALSFGPPVGDSLKTIHPSLSTPLTKDLVARRTKGGPLPAATFQRLVALEVGPDLVAELGLPTEVRTVFVTRDTPFTAKERAALRSLVSTSELKGSLATAITADDRSRDLRGPAGQVPWAPTVTSTQWSIITIAAALALLVVMSTATVDALDRRRDNYRLELLGATPNQVRGAAALHSGLVLGVGAVLAAAAVTALVGYGLERFSAARPELAVPFVFPLPQIAFLVVGVPLLGALTAAATAREARRAPRLRNATTSP